MGEMHVRSVSASETTVYRLYKLFAPVAAPRVGRAWRENLLDVKIIIILAIIAGVISFLTGRQRYRQVRPRILSPIVRCLNRR
jgi:hypothetical protein